MSIIIFPGQGSKSGPLNPQNPIVKYYINKAYDILGYNILDLSSEQLSDTKYSQPDLLVRTMILLEMFKAQNMEIKFVAGHSLGEYSACIAANGLTFQEGLSLVKQRAEFMSQYGQGSMVACIGPDIANIMSGMIADFNELYLANYNSNQQVVISGNTEQINELIVVCKSQGVKCIKLNVSAAFHSPFMSTANQLMNPLIFQANFQDIECGFISNKTNQILRSKAELEAEFEDQIILPVNWSSMCETISALVEQEGLPVYEMGHGNTLGKLLQQQTSIKSIPAEEVLKAE